MLTCIDVKFIFDSVRLGLSNSANILQILSRCRPPSCLFAVFAMKLKKQIHFNFLCLQIDDWMLYKE